MGMCRMLQFRAETNGFYEPSSYVKIREISFLLQEQLLYSNQGLGFTELIKYF